MKVSSSEPKLIELELETPHSAAEGTRNVLKDIFAFIKEVGVPAAIAFYILLRLEPAISANSHAIAELTIAIQRLAGK